MSRKSWEVHSLDCEGEALQGFHAGKWFGGCRVNGKAILWDRLDRDLASVDWMEMHPAVVVCHLARIASDYRLLSVNTEGTNFL